MQFYAIFVVILFFFQLFIFLFLLFVSNSCRTEALLTRQNVGGIAADDKRISDVDSDSTVSHISVQDLMQIAEQSIRPIIGESAANESRSESNSPLPPMSRDRVVTRSRTPVRTEREISSDKENSSVKTPIENDANLVSGRISRSTVRSQLTNIADKSEQSKRKRSQSTTSSTMAESKKARLLSTPISNEQPERINIASPARSSRSVRLSSKVPSTAGSTTPLKAKNDQVITKFFQSNRRCDICDTDLDSAAEMKFHSKFHAKRQCPVCDVKYDDDKKIDFSKHVSCLKFEDKFSKEQLSQMSEMRVAVYRLSHEEIQKQTQIEQATKPIAVGRPRKSERRSSVEKTPNQNKKKSGNPSSFAGMKKSQGYLV